MTLAEELQQQTAEALAREAARYLEAVQAARETVIVEKTGEVLLYPGPTWRPENEEVGVLVTPTVARIQSYTGV